MKNHDLENYPDVLTVREAAQVLRLGRDAAYAAIRRGELRAVKVGRRLVVPKHSLLRLLGATPEVNAHE
jgi:excisionase family DNA binding protein